MLKQNNPIPLNWDAETIVTNYFQCNYWGEKGAKRAVLARELNLDEILNIKNMQRLKLKFRFTV